MMDRRSLVPGYAPPSNLLLARPSRGQPGRARVSIARADGQATHAVCHGISAAAASSRFHGASCKQNYCDSWNEDGNIGPVTWRTANARTNQTGDFDRLA